MKLGYMRQITPPAEAYLIHDEPWYAPTADEEQVFRVAHEQRLPMLLKGPTGCGKTRFVRHMAYKLGRPLITVACHDDLTASDLVGRYLLLGDETVWMDGPLTAGVRHGAIVYLDEVVEARRDTLVVMHPLTDDRRILPVDRLGETLHAPAEFMLVISYNPGFQSALKELKPSTRQRFVALEFDFPAPDVERLVVARESGVDDRTADLLVRAAIRLRHLTDRGLEAGASTRALIHAGQLVNGGVGARRAAEVAIGLALTDDPELLAAVREILADFF
ncbi:MAG: nitric oxide reductase NorQ protein [Kiritimatiellia bacterium]|jgi:nitric oxide reductase NorQ protein